MAKQPQWLVMVRAYREVHGDPYEPFDAMTDYEQQKTEVWCHGCSAKGTSSWPTWEKKIEHDPECGWVQWKALLEE